MILTDNEEYISDRFHTVRLRQKSEHTGLELEVVSNLAMPDGARDRFMFVFLTDGVKAISRAPHSLTASDTLAIMAFIADQNDPDDEGLARDVRYALTRWRVRQMAKKNTHADSRSRP